ncbi:unnamed protein product [Mytilus edulis]|uniref:Uncharacterized protein n=1 Tax=Mytilus edulis TaxID=6550 RepID=A0A8S3TI04_MYTED|nr:unnamed protein product [Mytilus edulis]
MSLRGITSDNDGNLFVVGVDSSNVVIISNDGKHHRQILTGEDGLNEPSAIFFDKHTKKLLILDPSCGFDITIINEKTIAITSEDSIEHIGIDIIDTERRKKIKFINLPDSPYGITCDHDSLFVCVERRGMYQINTANHITSHVIRCNLHGGSFVSVFANKIYYTNWRDHSVVCCDYDGSRVWSFEDTSVLAIPGGITVDNDGNVFVVGQSSSNVAIISNDGKLHREILTDKDGLREPSAIFFDTQTKKLLVANKKRNCYPLQCYLK